MRVVLMIAGAVAFISVLATSSPGQRRRLRTPRELENREIEARQRGREMLERSVALERVGDGMSSPPVDEQRAARLQRFILLRQIEEDFERLQNAHNELMKLAVADHALDYVRISETSAEIKKRAIRLKTNLALPEPEESKKSTPQNLLDGEQIKASLFVISDLIIGFVTNPLFQHSKVIDAQLSIRASRDLQKTIELSDNIRKCAQRLRKTSKQSNQQAGGL